MQNGHRIPPRVRHLHRLRPLRLLRTRLLTSKGQLTPLISSTALIKLTSGYHPRTRPQGLDASYLIPPDKGLPLPDLTLFLSLSSEQTKTRGGFGDERFVISVSPRRPIRPLLT